MNGFLKFHTDAGRTVRSSAVDVNLYQLINDYRKISRCVVTDPIHHGRHVSDTLGFHRLFMFLSSSMKTGDVVDLKCSEGGSCFWWPVPHKPHRGLLVKMLWATVADTLNGEFQWVLFSLVFIRLQFESNVWAVILTPTFEQPESVFTKATEGTGKCAATYSCLTTFQQMFDP